VAVYHLAIATSEYRNLEAELADAAAHAIHDGVVLARIAGIEDQAVYGPDLYFELDGWFWRLHADDSTRESTSTRSSVSCAQDAGLRTDLLKQFYQKTFSEAHSDSWLYEGTSCEL